MNESTYSVWDVDWVRQYDELVLLGHGGKPPREVFSILIGSHFAALRYYLRLEKNRAPHYKVFRADWGSQFATHLVINENQEVRCFRVVRVYDRGYQMLNGRFSCSLEDHVYDKQWGLKTTT